MDENNDVEKLEAKYDAVQKWREESGSKERFKGKSLREEYLASLSDDRREELNRQEFEEYERRGGEPINFTSYFSPTDYAMRADGWR